MIDTEQIIKTVVLVWVVWLLVDRFWTGTDRGRSERYKEFNETRKKYDDN